MHALVFRDVKFVNDKIVLEHVAHTYMRCTKRNLTSLTIIIPASQEKVYNLILF